MGITDALSSSDKVVVAIVDDDSLSREALADHLNRTETLSVDFKLSIKEAVSGHLPTGHIDAVLWTMNRVDPESVQEIVQALSGARVPAALRVRESAVSMAAIGPGLLRSGARGVVSGASKPETIEQVLWLVSNGGYAVAPELAHRFLPLRAGGSRGAMLSGHSIRYVSRQEARTLLSLCSAKSNAEIAADLHISESTVKGHVSSLMRKLDCRTRLQIAIRAFETGLVHPPQPAVPTSARTSAGSPS